jgi:23S rRNA G2445 N2-methylase RlmL
VVESSSGYFFGAGLTWRRKQHSSVDAHHTQWKKRPYSFSAALSLDMADAVVNILVAMAIQDSSHNKSLSEFVFCDPCCGSGTTLYSALQQRLGTVYGFDINPVAIAGATKNLAYSGFCPSQYSLTTLDSNGLSSSHLSGSTADIVVANLPWGENVSQYYGENAKILRQLRRVTHAHSKIAVISQSLLESDELAKAGLCEGVTVPVDQDSDSVNKRAGKCYITFCTVRYLSR